MAKALTVASWNVEHFKPEDTDAEARRDRVLNQLASLDPDVFALYEVEGKVVFSDLVAKLPGYTFHITEGPQVQEILVGVRGSLSAFFTQRLEFKGGQTTLRPGALVTVTVEDANYSLLFLHTKSGNDPRGFGLRDDMMYRAVRFQSTLDRAVGGTANYMFMGDLNTMGMSYNYVHSEDVEIDKELNRLSLHATRLGMRLLKKDEPYTWWNGPGSSIPPSNLDHVVASQHLQFKQVNGADVEVKGWPKETTDAAKGQWIRDFSDHGILCLKVQGA